MPIDIPDSLRKESAEVLAEPLTEINNTCLVNETYPKTWKMEFVTHVPKSKPNIFLKKFKDVRKLASTSDFRKIFEIFLLKFRHGVVSDILRKKKTILWEERYGNGTCFG